MKWIGQHIYDLASRFRSDVYLESISSGTIASGAHLGLDSNNKIVKAVDGGGDLTSIVAGTGLSGTSLTGPIPTLNVDASQPTITTLAGLTAFGTNGVNTVFSGNSFQLLDTTASSATQGGKLNLISNDGAALGDDHRLGIVNFIAAEDASSTLQAGASIAAYADAAWSSTENGTRLLFRTMDGNASGQNVLTLDSDKLATFTGNIGIGGDTIAADGDLNIVASGNDINVDTDNFVITSATGAKPFLELKNTTNDNKGSTLQFTKDKGADGLDGDAIGNIVFKSDDRAQTQTSFASIAAKVSEADDTDEAGALTLSVAASDGTNTALKPGLLLEGEHATGSEVDVTIANGAASTTTIAGTLTMGSTATIDNSGAWVGGVIPSAKLDADTAHLTTAQTFTGSKTMATDVKLNFRDANSFINSPTANDIEVVATTITLDAASDIQLEGATTVTGNLSATGVSHTFQSSTASRPIVNILSTANDASSGTLQFFKNRGAAAENGDNVGEISFLGENDAEEPIYYGNILVEALEVDDTDEAGKMSFRVAESNGTTSGLTTGLLIEGSDNTTDGEVNVEIAAGAASITKINGSLRPKGQIVLMRAAFKDDIGTAKHYIPLQSELEQTTATHEMNSFVAPFPGKLLKLMFRGSGNLSGATFTFTLEKIKKDGAFTTSGNLSTLETVTATGPTNNSTDPNMITVDFVGGSGTNVFAAGDSILVGIQSDTDVTGGSSKFFFTLVTEFDFSGLA